jgi:gamma-tubulin complex component 2
LPGGACIPKFLEPWKHKILLAGKYLNVIRECGVDADRDGRLAGLGDGMIDLEDERCGRRTLTSWRASRLMPARPLGCRFHHFLEQAYIHANTTLLRMLVDEQDLQSHLRCVQAHLIVPCNPCRLDTG